jgi:hypothetical protein
MLNKIECVLKDNQENRGVLCEKYDRFWRQCLQGKRKESVERKCMDQLIYTRVVQRIHGSLHWILKMRMMKWDNKKEKLSNVQST